MNKTAKRHIKESIKCLKWAKFTREKRKEMLGMIINSMKEQGLYN